MKKTLKIIGIVLLVLMLIPFLAGLFGIGDETTKAKEATEITTEIESEEPKVELPAPAKCSSYLGVLKVDKNSGESTGKVTEKTELKRMLNEDCDIIEITYELKFESSSFKKKIVYDKTTNKLQDIYTKTNVIEEYPNVTPEALLEALNNNKGFYAIKGTEYNLNTDEVIITAVGKKPEQSELDASVKVVKDYIKANANDASSIKFLEWSKVTDGGKFWIVRCKYKGTNAIGGVVTENTWFYMQNEKVVKTKPIL